MDERFWCQGRWLEPAQVQWLAGWIALHPDWSRKRLAQQLCRAWHWRDGCGRLKDFAARRFLLKLQQRGLIRLPPVRPWRRRPPTVPPAPPPVLPPVQESLPALRPVPVRPVEPGTAPARRWAAYLQQYHYLGLRVVGENLGDLAQDRHGRDLACLLFGAPAWRCAARDRFLGWSEAPRREGLSRLANNTRFLLLPGVRVPHLASHLLGRVARRIQTDWRRKYGHGLDWLETFVEGGRFAGTSYRAANWIAVGQTTGRSRQDAQRQLQVPRKTVWLYRLAAAAPAPPPTVPRS
ncbi:MAG: Druantia anti-phage system protein DruA [Verrucomicrobiota bacterium]